MPLVTPEFRSPATNWSLRPYSEEHGVLALDLT
jgi:hypothetical protein